MSAVKNKHFTFSDDVYLVHYLVCIGGDFEQAQRLWHKQSGARDVAIVPRKKSGVGYFGLFPDLGRAMFWFDDKKPSGSIVAHECFHATSYILRRSGLVLSDKSEEAFAYYLGWLVKMIGRKVWS